MVRGNTTVALVVLCMLVGGVLGYVTRPQAAELRIGGASIEFENPARTATDTSGDLTSGQLQRVILFALGGGVVGLLVGFVANRNR